MSYKLYRPIYDEQGFYSHLEYWNGKEFTIDPVAAMNFPNRDQTSNAIQRLRKNYGLVYGYPAHGIHALDSAYRLKDRDDRRAHATPNTIEIPVSR
jgi:hypothetical protein